MLPSSQILETQITVPVVPNAMNGKTWMFLVPGFC